MAASNQYSQSVFHYGKLKQFSLILVYLLFSFAITSITRCTKQNNLFCSASSLRFYFIFVSRDVAPAELLQLNFVTYQVKWPLWQIQRLSNKQTVPNYRKRSHQKSIMSNFIALVEHLETWYLAIKSVKDTNCNLPLPRISSKICATNHIDVWKHKIFSNHLFWSISKVIWRQLSWFQKDPNTVWFTQLCIQVEFWNFGQPSYSVLKLWNHWFPKLTKSYHTAILYTLPF